METTLPDYEKELLASCAENLGFEIPQCAYENFARYKSMIVEWNEVRNLTAIREGDIVPLHFVDALTSVPNLQKKGACSVLDVGTGLGVPGLAVKIICPEMQLTMLDASEKRVYFVQQVISELGLKDCEVLHGRAEEYAQDERYAEQFDFVLARALAPLPTLIELCGGFLRIDGQLIAFKGSQAEQEIADSSMASQKLGLEFDTIEDCSDEKLLGQRRLVFYRKKASAEEGFPRSAQKIKKQPLVPGKPAKRFA